MGFSLFLFADISQADMSLTSGQGSIEFTAEFRPGATVAFPDRQIILSGVASDGTERVEIQVAGTDPSSKLSTLSLKSRGFTWCAKGMA
jgi:hypothetical protein